jgi:hypothetical protein
VIEIVPAKNGADTVKINGKFILSAYDPFKDAVRVARDTETDKKIFFLFSSSLGYLIDALIERGVDISDIFVYEPCKELMHYTLSRYPEIRIAEISEFSGIIEEGLLRGKRAEIIAVNSFKTSFPSEYLDFEDTFYRSFRSAVENLKVSAYFSKVWFANFLRNMLSLTSATNRFVFHVTGNIPKSHGDVIVTASGVSLDNHIEKIKAARDRFYIFSVLSSARTLLNNGIIPDAVIVSDAGVGNKLHFAGLPQDIPILASPYSSSALLCNIKNPVMFYFTDDTIENPHFSPSSPSVTIDAGIIARSLFKGKLIFAGLDLAYSLAGCHSRYNAFNEIYAKKSNRLIPFMNFGLSFLRRGDIAENGKNFTHSQFLMVRDFVSKTFGKEFYLEGGLGFDTMNLVKSLDSFGGRCRDFSVDKFGKTIEASTVRDIILDLCKKLKSRDSDLLKRVFVREFVTGSFNPEFAEYYAGKFARG